METELLTSTERVMKMQLATFQVLISRKRLLMMKPDLQSQKVKMKCFDSDSSGNQPPTAWGGTLLEEKFTTTSHKPVKTRGGARRSSAQRITATQQQSSSNDDSHDELRVIRHGQHQGHRRGWRQGWGRELSKGHGFRWGR